VAPPAVGTEAVMTAGVCSWAVAGPAGSAAIGYSSKALFVSMEIFIGGDRKAIAWIVMEAYLHQHEARRRC
jgi:hypothetical protein